MHACDLLSALQTFEEGLGDSLWSQEQIGVFRSAECQESDPFRAVMQKLALESPCTAPLIFASPCEVRRMTTSSLEVFAEM